MEWCPTTLVDYLGDEEPGWPKRLALAVDVAVALEVVYLSGKRRVPPFSYVTNSILFVGNNMSIL